MKNDNAAERRALGLCTYCDRPLSPTSINHCEYHGKLNSARARRRRELGTSKHKEYARKYRVVNRDKARARKLLAWHIQKGNVIRPDKCSKCQKPCKPEAHHEDYSKPMEVEWVCRDCHNLEHYPVRAALAPPAGTPKVTPEVAERVSGVIRKLAGTPRWVCTNCGQVEHKEREVVCWNCGKGEMVYQVADPLETLVNTIEELLDNAEYTGGTQYEVNAYYIERCEGVLNWVKDTVGTSGKESE